jgi:hypothetical protein
MEKNKIMKTFKEKGPRILFGQFLFFDCLLKVFLMGPPNHTSTPWHVVWQQGVINFHGNP